MRVYGPLLLAVVAVAGTPVCPSGYYRASLFLWECPGASQASDVMVDPTRPNVLLEIPPGVEGLVVSAEDDDRLDYVLLDTASPSVVVADNVQGIVNDLQPTGTYRSMTLTCLVSQGLEAWRKSCSWSTPTTASLSLKVESLSGSSELTVARLEATYTGLLPCPQVPHGCRPYNASEACEETLAFSRWARGLFEMAGGEEVAWSDLADEDAFVPQAAGGAALPGQPAERQVPYWAWSDVWKTDLPGTGKSFHFLDKNQNSFISKEEFLEGYRLALQSDACAAAGGAAAGTEGVTGWLGGGWRGVKLSKPEVTLLAGFAGLTLWIFLCVLLLCYCRKPAGSDSVPYQKGFRERTAEMSASLAAEDGLHHPWQSERTQVPRRLAAAAPPPASAPALRLAAYPALALAVEEHPASLRFHQARLLGYSDVLSDGFRAVFSQELLLLDSRKEACDTALRGFMSFLRSSLPLGRGASNAQELVESTAKAVAAGLGGGVSHEHVFGESLESRWRRRFQQLHLEFPRDLPIGLLLGGRAACGRAAHEPGAGLQRHRAVLFKYVCDALNVCSSALVWDTKRDVVLNVAWVAGRPLLVDVTQEPGQLTEDYELHQLVLQLESEHHGGPPLSSPGGRTAPWKK